MVRVNANVKKASAKKRVAPRVSTPRIVVQREGSERTLSGCPTDRTIKRRLSVMMVALDLSDRELSVLLTTDARIQVLNGEYRGVDKPTDVLSFSMLEGVGASFAQTMLGDLIVSVQTARRQAKQAKRSLLDEMTMLLAHGLLHLIGWDHQTKKQDKMMRMKTDELCVAAGGKPLFALGGVTLSGESVQIVKVRQSGRPG